MNVSSVTISFLLLSSLIWGSAIDLEANLGYEIPDESRSLFNDLEMVEKINHQIHDHLPVYYNANAMVGYFNMPSARMNQQGTVAFGGGYVAPYNVYGLNIQPFLRPIP